MINHVVQKEIWPAAKQDEQLANRGSDGVKKHWTAMVRFPSSFLGSGLMPLVQEDDEYQAVIFLLLDIVISGVFLGICLGCWWLLYHSDGCIVVVTMYAIRSLDGRERVE
jgi:uncharacterized membrane-anchored protein YitT (DUF2179 family)